jgi:glucokinase
MLFTLLLVFLAVFWAVIGLMIAKWLKQAGHTKPFEGRDIHLYGGGTGYGRDAALQGRSEREVRGFGEGRSVGLGGYGEGRVKGL